MGLPPSDCKLMRPIDEPNAAKIDFDWCQLTAEATTRRAELRRQKWVIRRRELEIDREQEFLDAEAGCGGPLPLAAGLATPLSRQGSAVAREFDNAYDDLTDGDFQEWQLGFELNVPIGFREGHVAVRNAELQLCRERAILRDQQREVVHEVADAVAEVDRAYTVLQTSYNRLAANRDQLGAIQAAYESDKVTFDLLLDAQRRVADAETDYYLSRTRYTLATKNVHFVEGTLLDYDGVHLAEGPWPDEAYVDAAKREASRSAPVPMNYASARAPVVSQGAFDQQIGESSRPGVEKTNPTPTDASPATITVPTDEVLPLPAPINGTSPTSPGGPMLKGASRIAQPEVIQTSAWELAGKKENHVIGAGHGEWPAAAVPKIALQPVRCGHQRRRKRANRLRRNVCRRRRAP